MKKKFLLLLLLSLGITHTIIGQNLNNENGNDLTGSSCRIIAHRGCWQQYGHPENSLAALKEALSKDIYAAECDVHQTADSVWVVNHDATYGKMVIAQNTYKQLSAHTLQNGERPPLLKDFLETLRHSTTPVKLIIEIKSGRIDELLPLVHTYGVESKVEYISFGWNYCTQLAAKGLGKKTYYLNGDKNPQEVRDAGLGGIDYSYKVLDTHTAWVKEAQGLGLRAMVWTVNREEDIRRYLQMGAYVTTNIPIPGK